MKKKYLSLALLAGIMSLVACNDGADTTTSTTDTSTMTTTDNTTMNDTSAMTNPNTTAVPLEQMDKDFVMKAASGGMMEVEASQIAQQNAGHARVKAFADMMVQDHTNANNELKGFASSRGLTIPQDSLMMKHKSMLDEMRKMTGKAFDKHYINMMMNDHNKDIRAFEKASNNCKDADLKAWAAKTLPTLRKHKDSVQALSKIKM
jgi:putative membrane protein